MKKLIIRKTNEGNIFSVELFDRYLHSGRTEDDVTARIKEHNSNLSEGTYPYQIVEVDDALYPIFEFLLGEGKYKGQKDVSDICDSLDDFATRVECLDGNLTDICSDIYSIQEAIKQMQKELKTKIDESN